MLLDFDLYVFLHCAGGYYGSLLTVVKVMDVLDGGQPCQCCIIVNDIPKD